MPARLLPPWIAPNRDDAVHVIVLTARVTGFCSGYDLRTSPRPRPRSGLAAWQPGRRRRATWDPMAELLARTVPEHFMSLWRSFKPKIARVHGRRSRVAATSRCAATS